MNNMDRINLFRQFIKDCEDRKEICGIGNPLAQILLVGQEFYVPMGAKIELKSELEKNMWGQYNVMECVIRQK